MIKIGVVGVTGKLGSHIARTILKQELVGLECVIGRKGNPFIGQDISSVIGGMLINKSILDDITSCEDCELFIDCTNPESFMTNMEKYKAMERPLLIGTTRFNAKEIEGIKMLSKSIPVFLSANFSIALYNFIETLKFAAKRITEDTDIQILEYHQKRKKDAPSGTAIMIKNALLSANSRLQSEHIDICSIRGGHIPSGHHVLFANTTDEVIEFKHQVSSREAFAQGAVEIAKWLAKQTPGFYTMDDFCS